MSITKIMRSMAAGIMAALMLQNMTMAVQAADMTGQSEIKLQAESVQNRATGVNVAYHTQDEINNCVSALGAKITDTVTFSVPPLTDVPYFPGLLSDETLNSAVNMLNQIRYIAGIPYNVALDDSYNILAQCASLVNYANNKMSHTPEWPEGMEEDIYILGKEGAKSSNIAWGSGRAWTLNYFIVLSWMEDGDESNIDRLGHRRWLLNPSMQKTGFGLVNGPSMTHSAVYVFDRSGNTSEYGVMWPAQNMPVEYFDTEFPWSISMGTPVDISKVHVTMKRNSDGRVWNFSQSSADGEFYVNNGNYGQKGCIIFRPDGIEEYKAGDSYDVNIVTGLSSGDVSYTVDFFNLEHIENPVFVPYVPEKPASTAEPAKNPGGTKNSGGTKNLNTVQDQPALKKLKLPSVKCAKNTKKITGKVSVSKASVKIKAGRKAYKKASVKGKKFTLKLNYKLKSKTRIIIKVEKKGYNTLIKSYTVK